MVQSDQQFRFRNGATHGSCPQQAAPHVDYICQGVIHMPAMEELMVVDGVRFKVVSTKGQYFPATKPIAINPEHNSTRAWESLR